VIGEREHMAERAQKASIRRGPGAAGSARVLGDAVAAQLRTLELEPDTVSWDSWRRHDGRWSVVGQFATPVWSGTAELTFDPPGNFVSLDNDDARWLVGDLPAATVEPVEPVRDDLAQVRERRLSPAPALFEEETLPLVDEPVEMFLEPTGETPAIEQAPTKEPAPQTEAAVEAPAEPVAEPAAEEPPAEQPPVRRTVAKKRGRASVPSWDEIMFGGGSNDPA